MEGLGRRCGPAVAPIPHTAGEALGGLWSEAQQLVANLRSSCSSVDVGSVWGGDNQYTTMARVDTGQIITGSVLGTQQFDGVMHSGGAMRQLPHT